MPKVAPIVPIANLQDVADFRYQLCLTYLCQADTTYLAHYAQLAQDKQHHVILDNSVHELRQPDSVGRIIAFAREIRPQEIVLPDHIDDADATLESAEMAKGLLGSSVKIMAVPQGHNFQMWKWCLKKLIGLGISTIGLTRYKWNEGERAELVKYILAEYGTFPEIHLLGWKSDEDFVWPYSFRSTDTAKPAVYAYHGHSISTLHLPRLWPGRPDDFFQAKVDSKLLRLNFQTMQVGLNYAARPTVGSACTNYD